MPLCLLVAACRYPAGLLDGTPRRPENDPRVPIPDAFKNPLGPADAALERMTRLRTALHPSAVVWTGDRIYIDATAGLFDPAIATTWAFIDSDSGAVQAAALVRAHDSLDANPHYVRATRELMLCTAIDDHEIGDNWEPSGHAQRNAALRRQLARGRDAFVDLARRLSRPPDRRGDSEMPLWQELAVGSGHPMFVADSRTEREGRSAPDLLQSRIMSRRQWRELRAWMLRLAKDDATTGVHKLVVTPSILLPRRLATSEAPLSALRSDAWDGYPRSLHDLLGFIAEARVRNCVFLSGDEHLPCVVTADVSRVGAGEADRVRLWSAHTGAMYAPYPFANSRPHDFSDEACFGFESSVSGIAKKYECRIVTRWFPAVDTDGFMSVRVEPDAGGHAGLAISYHAANGIDYSWPG